MRNRTTGTLAAIAFATAGVVVFAVWRSAAVELAYPVERACSAFMRKATSVAGGLWRGAAAAAENARLKRQLAALAMDRVEYERVMDENSKLRESLGFMRRQPGRWVAAEVLSQGGGAAFTRYTLRIDKGTLEGVAEGAVVEAPEGLVGRVVSTTPHTSEVLLVTDPSLKVSCEVCLADGLKPVRGILSGGADDSFVIKHLTAGAEVPPRAKVYTSGLGGVFPAGIAVGTFNTDDESGGGAERGTGELEREGKVQPAVDFSTLEVVFVRR